MLYSLHVRRGPHTTCFPFSEFAAKTKTLPLRLTSPLSLSLLYSLLNLFWTASQTACSSALPTRQDTRCCASLREKTCFFGLCYLPPSLFLVARLFFLFLLLHFLLVRSHQTQRCLQFCPSFFLFLFSVSGQHRVCCPLNIHRDCLCSRDCWLRIRDIVRKENKWRSTVRRPQS